MVDYDDMARTGAASYLFLYPWDTLLPSASMASQLTTDPFSFRVLQTPKLEDGSLDFDIYGVSILS